MKKEDPVSKRQQRHLSAIAEFDYSIHHVSGKMNPVADALSRNCSSLTTCGIDLKDLAAEQEKDPPPLSPDTHLSSWRASNFQTGQPSYVTSAPVPPDPGYPPHSAGRSSISSTASPSHPERRPSQRSSQSTSGTPSPLMFVNGRPPAFPARSPR